MKYIFCCLVLFSQIKPSFSQVRQDTLLVVPGKNGLYFYHIVDKKETLYALSRKFQVDAGQLANFNNLTLKSPLKLYQLVKIPLNNKNLEQSVAASSVSQLKPLYHKVIKGETLYHIGKMHDNVSSAALKKWNHIQNNEVTVGQYLIVGWLNTTGKNTEMASSPPGNAEDAPSDVLKGKEKGKQLASSGETQSTNISAEEQTTSQPAVTQTSAASSEGNSFLNEVIASENRSRNRKLNAPVEKDMEEPVKRKEQTNMVQTEDDAFSVQQAPPASQPGPEPVVQEDVTVAVKKDAPVKMDSFARMLNQVTHAPKAKTLPQQVPVAKPVLTPEKATDQASVKVDSLQLVPTVKSEFEKQYAQQTDNNARIVIKKGAAGWFHSNVKPGSGRYYALCDDLPRGTIVEVINPINQKSVLVKILDVIPKQKENYNLIIKLSDAAMGDLGVSQSRFWCEIRYGKQDTK